MKIGIRYKYHNFGSIYATIANGACAIVALLSPENTMLLFFAAFLLLMQFTSMIMLVNNKEFYIKKGK